VAILLAQGMVARTILQQGIHVPPPTEARGVHRVKEILILKFMKRLHAVKEQLIPPMSRAW